MYITTPKTEKILILICGIPFAFGSILFAYYTVRLIYINLTMEDAAAHRSFGMLIGALAFPLAAIIFGFISWYFIKMARRYPSQNRER